MNAPKIPINPSKSYASPVLAFAFLALAAWTYSLRTQLLKATAEAAVLRGELAKSNGANSGLRGQLGRETEAVNVGKSVAARELHDLEVRAGAERLRGAQLLAQLRELSSAQPKDSRDLDARTKAAQDLVQNLESKRRLLGQSNEAVGRDRKSSLEGTQNGARAERERLNEQISAQQQIVKNTQSQLAYWRGQRSDPSRAGNVQNLTRDEQGGQALLSSLRQQKVANDQAERQGKADGAAQADSQKQVLTAETSELAGQLNLAKAELAESLKIRAELRRGETDLGQKKQRLQREVQANGEKIKALDVDIARKREELALINSKER